MEGTRSPDDSLAADEGFLATPAQGISYPLGREVPVIGELMPLAKGVRWARLPLKGALGHINSWLIDDHDRDGPGVAIVDTGFATRSCREAWDALLAGPLAGQRITRVVCTHYHPDHIGMAGWLCERSRAPLWMTRTEWLLARMLSADVRETPPSGQVDYWRFAGWSDAQIAAASAQGWGRFAAAVTPLPVSYIRMENDDILRFGDTSWRVVIGRGHAPEHACLWNESEGLLIAGDQILPKISSNVSVSLSEPEGNPLGDWLDSIDRLLDQLPADLLVLPAHGEPFKGLHARLRSLRDGHHRRLEKLAAALAEPKRVVDCFTTLFGRPLEGGDFSLGTGEALAHLRWLERRNQIHMTQHDGVGWFSAMLN